MPRLENWSITTDCQNDFMAPELMVKRLHGEIYNSESFYDGTIVSTSILQEFNFKNKTAKTLYTSYDLGEIDKGYERHLINNNIDLNDLKYNN